MHRNASWVTSWTGTWRAPSFEPSRMFDENITRNASDRAISTQRWACSSLQVREAEVRWRCEVEVQWRW